MPYKYAPVVEYLKQDNEIVTGKSRVLVYPLASILWCDGNGSYWGNDILRFSGIPTVSTVYQVNFQKQSNFISSLSDNAILSDNNYANYIKKLGIKYIVVKRQACDVDPISGNIIALNNQSKQIEENLNGKQFVRVMENPYYSIFRVPGGSTSLSMIAAPIREPLKYSNNNAASSIYSANAFSLLMQDTTGQPVNYQKISSTEYIVNIQDSRKPFYLIFAESYDDGWKAFINGNEHLPDKYHFNAGGFANGWYLNKIGHFSIRLSFQPQKYHDIGLSFYILVICVSSITLLLYTHKEGIGDGITRLFKPTST
jgi:hypothetical protein